jgi:hypothetical protein
MVTSFEKAGWTCAESNPPRCHSEERRFPVVPRSVATRNLAYEEEIPRFARNDRAAEEIPRIARDDRKEVEPLFAATILCE